MKQTRNILIVGLILFLFSILFNDTLAAERAVFPDGKLLQPPPVNVHPNISGNINSHLEKKENFGSITFPQIKPSSDSEKTSTDNSKNSQNHANFLIIIFSVVFVLFLGFILYLIKRKNDIID